MLRWDITHANSTDANDPATALRFASSVGSDGREPRPEARTVASRERVRQTVGPLPSRPSLRVWDTSG